MKYQQARFVTATFRLCVPILVTCALLLTPSIGWAHAVLLKSTPQANATLPAGNVDVVLKFNSRVDGSRSSVLLSMDKGTAKPLPLEKQTAPDTLASHISGLSSGAYALDWQVLSVDGHITRGRIPFQVK